MIKKFGDERGINKNKIKKISSQEVQNIIDKSEEENLDADDEEDEEKGNILYDKTWEDSDEKKDTEEVEK